MRSRSRAELFDLVCEAAAAGGRFTSTSISLARPGSDFMETVGVAGPTAENSRKVRISVSEQYPEGRGVCGTAAAERRTVVVPDVEAFPGHIACDGRSRSEIVVPVLDRAGTLLAVLDVDSDRVGAFDDEDARGLERIAGWFAGRPLGDLPLTP